VDGTATNFRAVLVLIWFRSSEPLEWNSRGAYSTIRDMRRNVYHVYILASASRVLYTGITSDLKRRVFNHQTRRVPGFTQKYHVTQLMYCEAFRDVRDAIAREKQIKAWTRAKRIALIEKLNPHWRDLSADWLAKSNDIPVTILEESSGNA
jgi:putative endonuclease